VNDADDAGGDRVEPPALPPFVARVDPRDLKGASVVADRNGYYDSQNIVVVGAGSGALPTFSVVFHHSENREGGPGLQLWATRSVDRGRSWSAPVAIEPPERQSHDGYQLVHRGSDGRERLYLFYGWNVGSHPPDAVGSGARLARTDMQLDEGYWMRISDDRGRSWGARRWSIPVRRTRIDLANPWGGATMGMFLCDKPSVIDGAVYMAFQKTRDGAGETPGSEVFFLRSPDLLHVADPADASWETLPTGDDGLRAPGGELDLGEEPHVLAVGDTRGRLFTLWRTEVGRLAAAYSDDGGQTWGPPFWLTYEGKPLGAGGEQQMKNPRGSITPFRRRGRAPDGSAEYVLLFYNNGRTERLGYTGRRVYWLTVGRSTPDGHIRWTQPEVALYWDGVTLDDRPGWNPEWAIVDGPGYPDWAELDDGTLVCVESNKLAVRHHEIDPRMLAFARAQPELSHVSDEGRVVDWSPGDVLHAAPILPDLRAGGGFTITIVLSATLDEVLPSSTIVAAYSDVTAALGEEPTDRRIAKGYELRVTENREIELVLADGFHEPFRHATGVAAATVWDGGRHAISFILDGGPRIASAVVDERLDDGGEGEQGWVFHPPHLGEIGGSELTIEPQFGGVLHRLLVFDRPLLTTEAVAAARALRGASPLTAAPLIAAPHPGRGPR
jgi:hypothetical protein